MARPDASLLLARSFSPEEAALLARPVAVVMRLLDLRLPLIQQPTWNQQLG